MEVVVQGKIFPNDTIRVVQNLLATNFVTKVIVSCWNSCEHFGHIDDRVEVVRSTPPINPGITNRNLQIHSSYEGLQRVTSADTVKFRSDQIITVDSLERMNHFFTKFRQPNRLFVCGDFTLPFHPRDHVYWGAAEDVKALFNIPLDSQPQVEGEQYDKYLRSETYIAMFYYARFEPEVQKMIDNPLEYLVDGAPKYGEAIALSNALRDKYFKVFPRIDLIWPKHGIYGYRYDSQSVWERWHDESW